MQRRYCVEREVIRVLHKRLKSHVPISSDTDYLSYKMDFGAYNEVARFKSDYFISSFLRKWKGIDTNIDLEGVTYEGWISSEQECLLTNLRLRREMMSGFYSIPPSIISDAQRKISSLLGEFSLERIHSLYRFSGGATYDLRRGSNVACKMKSDLTITRDCLPYFRYAVCDDSLWFPDGVGTDRFRIVDCDRLIMVPKNAKTHRMISTGPTLNGFVQQGFGRYIRSVLKRVGVDLDDQTINQGHARRAYIDGLSTIDLRSASDRLAFDLVRLLLPLSWFQALAEVRVGFSEFKGKRYRLQKFSAMGNAYTFELESLIFWALVSSVTDRFGSEGFVSVYGDDIIINRSAYDMVVKTLSWAGFSMNNEKSFKEGDFFESCGTDFFRGELVTPAYQKEVVSDDPLECVRLHNRLVRAGERLGLRAEFRDAILLVRDYAKKISAGRLGVGPDLGHDNHLVDPTVDFVDGFRVRSVRRVDKTRYAYGDGNMHYSYKLRHPTFQNSDPKGQGARIVGSSVIYYNARLWRSGLVG